MPYGNKARSVRAYEFGCLPPASGETEATWAMRDRVRLWNRLVEITQPYLREREAVVASRLPGGLSGRERGAAVRAVLATEEMKAQLATMAGALQAERKRACAESGLYWCNWEEVTLAWQNALRATPIAPSRGFDLERDRPRKGDLRFHSVAREPGKITVRWQRGLPVAELFGTDTRAQVDPVDPSAWTSTARAVRRRAARTALRLRVASDDRHRPVWLVLPMVMHRPLPEDGLVRSISVLRERLGLSWRWKVVIVVESAASAPISHGVGAVSIDLGWRKLPDRLRVAVWRGEDGQTGEVCLPVGWVHEIEKTEDLRSIRDGHFNAARGVLSEWMLTRSGAPDWLTEEAAHLPQWRSEAKLARLHHVWEHRRFDGDESAFAALDAWWKRERHLYEYEAHLRDQCLKGRREIYRCFAADLVRHYSKIVLEHFDLRPIVRRASRPKAEQSEIGERRMWDAAMHHRFLVGPSTLRLAVRNAAGREGLEVTEMAAAYTTLVCSACGRADWYDTARELVHECSACGTRLDQDENAARNLLDGEFSQRAARARQEKGLRGTDAGEVS